MLRISFAVNQINQSGFLQTQLAFNAAQLVPNEISNTHETKNTRTEQQEEGRRWRSELDEEVNLTRSNTGGHFEGEMFCNRI